MCEIITIFHVMEGHSCYCNTVFVDNYYIVRQVFQILNLELR